MFGLKKKKNTIKPPCICLRVAFNLRTKSFPSCGFCRTLIYLVSMAALTFKLIVISPSHRTYLKKNFAFKTSERSYVERLHLNLLQIRLSLLGLGGSIWAPRNGLPSAQVPAFLSDSRTSLSTPGISGSNITFHILLAPPSSSLSPYP